MSGGATAGGACRFRAHVLPGDANHSGTVTLQDWVQERLRRSRSTTAPGAGPFAYDVLHDLDGDGKIDDTDLNIVRRNLLQSLPAAERTSVLASARALPPALAAALAARSASAALPSATRDLFSAVPILN